MSNKTTNTSKKVKQNFLSLNTNFTNIALVLGLTVLFILAIFNFALQPNKTEPVVLGENIELEYEAVYWTKFLQENPNYAVGWLELARIQIKLGKKQEASSSLQNAKNIDPNLDEIYTIEYQL